jgi:hypothetical protein
MSGVTKVGYLVIVVGLLTALTVRAQVKTDDSLLREIVALRRAEETRNVILRDILTEMKRQR